MGFTTNQWIIVALVFVLGWLLGLLSRSDKGYKAEARAQRERAEAAEARADTAETNYATAQKRITELDRPTPVAAPVVTGTHDDLSLIHGIGRDGAPRLGEAGYRRYEDIAALSERDAAALEQRFDMAPGTIAREDWRGQATTLIRDRRG